MAPPPAKKSKLLNSKSDETEKLLVVAEEEWELHSTYSDYVDVTSTKHFGEFKWEWTFTCFGKFELKCLDLGGDEKIHLELLVYVNQVNNLLNLTEIEMPYRSCVHKKFDTINKCLTKDDRSITVVIPDNDDGLVYDSLLLTMRILKPRSQLYVFCFSSFFNAPKMDMNEPIVKVRIQEPVEKERVFQEEKQTRVFHVNKRILTKNSSYFDRMLNGDFVEANKDEILLEPKGYVNAENFELYLLTISKHGHQFKMLPSLENVEILLEMSNFFIDNSLKKKCENHLLVCREMPIKKRIKMAKKFGLEKLQKKLTDEVGCLLELEKKKEKANERLYTDMDKKERKKKRKFLKHCLALLNEEYAMEKEKDEEDKDEEEEEEDDENEDDDDEGNDEEMEEDEGDDEDDDA